jgi:uncharacterized protein YjiS (DUF1127 family)
VPISLAALEEPLSDRVKRQQQNFTIRTSCSNDSRTRWLALTKEVSVFEDARPYVAHAFGDAALQFVWLSLKHAAGRVVQNCVHAFAEGWREERMRRELFALSDHLLKDIGLSRSEIGKLPGCLRSRPAELWPTDVATLTQERRARRGTWISRTQALAGTRMSRGRSCRDPGDSQERLRERAKHSFKRIEPSAQASYARRK